MYCMLLKINSSNRNGKNIRQPGSPDDIVPWQGKNEITLLYFFPQNIFIISSTLHLGLIFNLPDIFISVN